jgi:5-methylcytosine-specific restriction endonuclease McrA
MVHIRHCFYCGKALSRRRATKDHVIPRSKGGSNTQKNIVDACRKCNSEKGCLSIEEFRVVMAFRKGALKPPRAFRFPGEMLFD